MKKIVLVFLLILTPYLKAIEEPVTPELLKLLKHFKIEHNGTLDTITKETQKAWLRPAGKERWETVCTYTDEDRAAVLEYYQKTGKLGERAPSMSRYQVALLCGATTGRMQRRIRYFEKVVERGVQVDKVALLAGARFLDPAVDMMLESAKSEGDAFVLLWKTSHLSQQIPWQLYEHPMKGSKRPVTYDTFKYWMQDEEPQTLLIVADQPYCAYFEAVAAKAFLPAYSFEVVGEGIDPSSISTATLLDNLTRWLYAINN